MRPVALCDAHTLIYLLLHPQQVTLAEYHSPGENRTIFTDHPALMILF